MSSSHSSGNLLADRRYQYALAALAEGDSAAGADLLTQALAIAPQWAAGWFALGEAREKTGDMAGAALAFTQALAFDARDSFGAAARLSLLGGGPAPDRLPPDFVRGLFDAYAPRFDAHLVEDLSYRGPELLRERMQFIAGDIIFPRVVDLGCGTGLAGAAFRPQAGALLGCDISPAMVAQARERQIYDVLEVSDLVPFLDSVADRPAELVLAADVLVYVGALDGLFAAVAAVLQRRGHFAFTVQRIEDGDFRLLDQMRFGYSRAYLERICAGAGLKIVLADAVTERTEGGRPAPGLAVVACRS